MQDHLQTSTLSLPKQGHRVLLFIAATSVERWFSEIGGHGKPETYALDMRIWRVLSVYQSNCPGMSPAMRENEKQWGVGAKVKTPENRTHYDRNNCNVNAWGECGIDLACRLLRSGVSRCQV